MTKNGLYRFEWQRCDSGYIIEPHNKRLSLRDKEPQITTLLTNADYFPEKMIGPLGATYRYDLFALNWQGLPRTFSELIEGNQKSLDNKKVIKFAKKYGLLGYSQGKEKEDLETWYKWVSYISTILDFCDGKGRKDFDVAIELYNLPPLPLFMKPHILKNNKASLASRNNSSFNLVPENLITVIYLILGDYLSKGSNLQRCKNPNCFEWFRARSNKRWCSTSCKTAGNR
ncbi:MAG: CGNR zinc finger domain-containing protein [Alphaproteobacteria bacterium]|nr:CGNR zinc finger domain-containing protein [Alphaproteobacteria bacterium]NCQ88939.1 CGNR zinc finger domain-containing protein [Alphaproteobacteria bacterium]NCT07841.1 CGNR zinc finger domain-containing protein [Alphaproteobacteria bacterium]